MKKMIVLALSILLLANTYSLAKRAMRGEFATRSTHQQDDRVKIKKEELPEAARKTLEGDAFKGWTIVNSFKTKAGEYEVELKKGDNAQTIKFNKDGIVK
jgi:hypothetical protein